MWAHRSDVWSFHCTKKLDVENFWPCIVIGWLFGHISFITKWWNIRLSCVVNSIYKCIEIIESCNLVSCSKMRSLEPRDCEKMNCTLPMRAHGSKKKMTRTFKGNNMDQRQVLIGSRRGWKEINQILMHIVCKRVARSLLRKAPFPKDVASSYTLGILHSEPHVCV